MKEANNINKSLAALGDVLRALARGATSERVIPKPQGPVFSFHAIH